MRCKLLVLAIVLFGSVQAAAQSPTYNLGRSPTREELHPPDAAISPDGDELPPGSGTAKEGEVVYLVRCALFWFNRSVAPVAIAAALGPEPIPVTTRSIWAAPCGHRATRGAAWRACRLRR